MAPSMAARPAAGRVSQPDGTTLSVSKNVIYGTVDLPPGSTNLALGRPTSQIDGGSSSGLAVDGKTSGAGEDRSIATLADYRPTPWWEVDLGESQPISFIQVWPRTDACCLDRLNNFNVFVSDHEITATNPYETRRQPGLLTFYVFGMPSQPTTIEVHSSGRYVRIQQAHQSLLDLAEVEVWSDPSATTTASP